MHTQINLILFQRSLEKPKKPGEWRLGKLPSSVEKREKQPRGIGGRIGQRLDEVKPQKKTKFHEEAENTTKWFEKGKKKKRVVSPGIFSMFDEGLDALKPVFF